MSDELLHVPMRDASVACRIFGARDRPPILLLRPLGGSISAWGRFADRLAERRLVIAFDPPGVGRSTGRAVASTRAMADDAMSVLDHLEIDRADVFGISLGGMVASWIAVGHRARLRRLVLASTCARTFDATASWRRPLAFVPCFASASDATLEGCLVRAVLSREFRKRAPKEVERIVGEAAAFPTRRANLLRLVAAAARHDLLARLHSIRASTLVVAGSFDRLLKHAAPRRLARTIPGARLVTLQGGHDLSLEAPDETARIVLDHVEK